MSKRVSHQPTKQSKQDRRRDRREEQRLRAQQQMRAARNRRTATIVGSLVVVVLVVAGAVFFLTRPAAPTTSVAAPPTSSDTADTLNTPVDNIPCDQLEHSDEHVHQHLSIYINGSQVQIPANIGIVTSPSDPTNATCFYWIHTHTSDGFIHVEAPSNKLLTLGNFIHIWGQQFSQLQFPSELDQTNGWQAYIDGKPYKGDFHDIVLSSHQIITLAFQSPNIKPDTVINWGDLTQ